MRFIIMGGLLIFPKPGFKAKKGRGFIPRPFLIYARSTFKRADGMT
jgi:hypothetical protein